MLHAAFSNASKTTPSILLDGLRFLGACGAVHARLSREGRAYAFNHRSTGFERNSIACGTHASLDETRVETPRWGGNCDLSAMHRKRERKVAHEISLTEGWNEKWNNWNRPWFQWAGSPLRFGSWTDWGSDGEVWACFFLCVERN